MLLKGIVPARKKYEDLSYEESSAMHWRNGKRRVQFVY